MTGRLLVLICAYLLVNACIAQPVSGYDYLSAEIKEIQDDDFLNPGMSAVERGQQLFIQADDDGRACADCHGAEGEKLNKKRIAAYPGFDHILNQVLTLQDRIRYCRTEKLDRFPLVYDHKDLVDLETFVRSRARGETIHIEVTDDTKEIYEAGKALYNKRFGQMGMTCHHCHEQYQSIYLRGRKLTQGQTNGFPVYRFESDRITSLHRRFNECFVQLRAEPFDKGGDEYRALEYYMGVMSNGLKVETPGDRF